MSDKTNRKGAGKSRAASNRSTPASVQTKGGGTLPATPTKPRKKRGTATETIAVTMSRRQASLIRRYAFNLRAKPGDLIAALALSEIALTDGSNEDSHELNYYNTALIEFVHRRLLPADRSDYLISTTHVDSIPAKKGGA